MSPESPAKHHRYYAEDFYAAIEYNQLSSVKSCLQSHSYSGFAAAGLPLHTAIRGYANFELIKFLLTKGADPNEANEQGETPLHLAAKKGFFEVIELLLAKGADLSLVRDTSYQLMIADMIYYKVKQRISTVMCGAQDNQCVFAFLPREFTYEHIFLTYIASYCQYKNYIYLLQNSTLQPLIKLYSVNLNQKKIEKYLAMWDYLSNRNSPGFTPSKAGKVLCLTKYYMVGIGKDPVEANCADAIRAFIESLRETKYDMGFIDKRLFGSRIIAKILELLCTNQIPIEDDLYAILEVLRRKVYLKKTNLG